MSILPPESDTNPSKRSSVKSTIITVLHAISTFTPLFINANIQLIWNHYRLVGERSRFYHPVSCPSPRKSVAEAMATWNDLPPEIRDIILNFFCLGIVHEYTELGKDPWRGCGFYWAPRGPKCPRSLSNLLSALGTCRHFRFVVQHIIRLDNLSTIEKLQLLQYQRVGELVDGMPVYGRHPSIVGMFKELAGRFWMNPYVIDDLCLVEQLLDKIPVESRT